LRIEQALHRRLYEAVGDRLLIAAVNQKLAQTPLQDAILRLRAHRHRLHRTSCRYALIPPDARQLFDQIDFDRQIEAEARNTHPPTIIDPLYLQAELTQDRLDFDRLDVDTQNPPDPFGPQH